MSRLTGPFVSPDGAVCLAIKTQNVAGYCIGACILDFMPGSGIYLLAFAGGDRYILFADGMLGGWHRPGSVVWKDRFS